MDMQSFLNNTIFFVLLAVTIFYWASISRINSKLLSKISFYGTLLANLLIFSLLALRWGSYGYFPLSNMYESLFFLAWAITFTTIVIESRTKTPLVGSIGSPISLFVTGFAGLSLPEIMRAPSALAPALKSNWLMMHVTVMMLSYSSLMIGSLLGVLFLILTNGRKGEIALQGDSYGGDSKESGLLGTSLNDLSGKVSLYDYKGDPLEESSFGRDSKEGGLLGTSLNDLSGKVRLYDYKGVPLEESPFYRDGDAKNYLPPLAIRQLIAIGRGEVNRLSLLESVDNLSYQTIGFGFPLLTVGIIAGSVWANEAWGSYWSWDPKETWALITWLIFASYLHARINRSWKGRGPAIIASLGFVVVWICYLGVNFLGTGLHTYGQIL